MHTHDKQNGKMHLKHLGPKYAVVVFIGKANISCFTVLVVEFGS